MSRDRSRTVLDYPGPASVFQKYEYTNPAFDDGEIRYQQESSPISVIQTKSRIIDFPMERPQVEIDPQSGSWKRIRYKRPGFRSASLRPVRNVSHVQSEVSYEKDLLVTEARVDFAGNPIYEAFVTRATTYASSAFYIAQSIPFLGTPDQLMFGSGHTNLGAADDFRKHDWFALMDSFNEACEQFIPDAFMLGEDIAQSSIFIDALKCVLNPTRAIKLVVESGLRASKKVRRMNFKHAAQYLVKNAADPYLFYNFGVKPAIEDVKAALDAHRKVSKRMYYLRQRAGGFVPVRVRKTLSSDVSNVPLGVPGVGNTDVMWQYDSRESTACISSWGRVREDLNFEDTWSAYLQYFGINKVVGLLWELIPFSFVLDWFTNAQERINSYTRLRTGGPFTEFRNFCCSEKKVTTEKLYAIPGYNPISTMHQTGPNDPFVVATLRTTEYSRSSKLPDTSGVVDLSTLGLFHSLTSGALLVQRWLK